MGGKRPKEASRTSLGSGGDPYGGTSIYDTSQGGIPAPGTRYEVEIEVVLFETDVPPGHAWDSARGPLQGAVDAHAPPAGGVSARAVRTAQRMRVHAPVSHGMLRSERAEAQRLQGRGAVAEGQG